MRRAFAIISVVIVLFVVLAVFMHLFGGGSGSPSRPLPSTSAPAGTGNQVAITNPVSSTPTISLDGTLVCLGCDEINRELWSKMREFNASDPRVRPYIEWLREALAEKPVRALTSDPSPKVKSGYGVGFVRDSSGASYWWVDAASWRSPPDDGDVARLVRLSDTVRIGVIKMGFGTGLIVTAWPVYSSGGDWFVDIVIHGTVINATEYMWTALYRALAQEDISGRFIDRLNESGFSVALFRLLLRGGGSYLDKGNWTQVLIRNIYVLVEMPIAIKPGDKYGYTRSELEAPEYVGWMLIGRPALGLAIRLAYPPDTDIAKLYRELVVGITTDLVSRGTYYMWEVPYIERMVSRSTVLGLRNAGGFCMHYADVTSFFASQALGALAAEFGEPMVTNHDMSVVIIPSSVFGRVETVSSDAEGVPGAGPIDLHHDVDGDNVTDAGVMLANTDPVDFTLDFIDEVLQYIPLRVYVPGIPIPRETDDPHPGYEYYLGSFYYFMGFTDYAKSLPDWLLPPWYPLLRGVFDRITVLPSFEDLEKNMDVRMIGYSFAIALDKLNATPVSRVEAPSYRLALRGVINDVPLVDTGLRTTPIKLFEILYNTTVVVPNQQSSSPETSAVVSLAVNATWTGHGYRGEAVVGDQTLVVLVWRTSDGVWVWGVWLGDRLVRYGSLGWSLPGENVTLEFVHEAAVWRVTVHLVGLVSLSDISATILLEPVYEYESTPWGLMPFFKEYRGGVVAGGVNVTAVARCGGYRFCDVVVYVNRSQAYYTSTYLPSTVNFIYNGTRFTLHLEVPQTPVLNLAVEPRLVPLDCLEVTFSNGSAVCVNRYVFNETVRVGNATVIVYGSASRIEVEIHIYVFGVPPESYTVSVDGLWVDVSIEYNGALHVYAYLASPYARGGQELLPEGTVKITIHPLELTVVIPVKG